MRNLSDSSLVKVATSLRRRAEQIEPSFSTTQIIEVCFPKTVVTGRRMEPGLDEVVRIDSGRDPCGGRDLRRRHVIVYNRMLPPVEQRFAIAHGLGHVIFDGAKHPGCYAYDDESERRCDRFASELLVPLEELAPYVCRWPSATSDEHDIYLDMVDMIASHFNVTSSLIDQRIRQLPRSLG